MGQHVSFPSASLAFTCHVAPRTPAKMQRSKHVAVWCLKGFQNQSSAPGPQPQLGSWDRLGDPCGYSHPLLRFPHPQLKASFPGPRPALEGRPRVAEARKAGGAPELARRDAARWICRLQLLQLHRRRREEGRRAVRRAGAPARREGGRGAGRVHGAGLPVCQLLELCDGYVWLLSLRLGELPSSGARGKVATAKPHHPAEGLCRMEVHSLHQL